MPRPDHYRPPIPVPVKGDILIRQKGLCGCGCGEHLGSWKNTQFDHVPALELREWSDKEEDTIPPANDPNYIFAKRRACHDQKTFGAKHNRVGSDIHAIHKSRRLQDQTRELNEINERKAGRAPEDDTPFEIEPTVIPKMSIDAMFSRTTQQPREGQRMRGRGFQTNRDGPYRAKMRGGITRRERKD